MTETIRVDVSKDPAGIVASLREFSNFSPGMVGFMTRASEILRGSIVRAIRDRLNPEGRRTGALMRSYRTALVREESPGVVKAGVFSDLIYAHIQDQGGTINAKPGKWLTIPNDKVVPVGARARDFTDTFFVRDSGGLYLMQHRESGPVLLFTLRKSVTLPGKDYLDAAMRDAEPKILAEIRAEIDRRIEEFGQ